MAHPRRSSRLARRRKVPTLGARHGTSPLRQALAPIVLGVLRHHMMPPFLVALQMSPGCERVVLEDEERVALQRPVSHLPLGLQVAKGVGGIDVLDIVLATAASRTPRLVTHATKVPTLGEEVPISGQRAQRRWQIRAPNFATSGRPFLALYARSWHSPTVTD